MKYWLIALLCSFFSAATPMKAQPSSVTLELELTQRQFLPGEDILALVKITNLSGQPLDLGDQKDWLTFVVESRDQKVVEKYSNPDVTGAFSLRSSTSGTKKVNIAPHFNLQTPGRYEVAARIKIPQWNIEVNSRPVLVDIVRGAKMREIQFGVPAMEGEASKAPEIRKYILQQTEYRTEMKLYLRLTDAYEGKTYKLYPIARTMSFSKPEMHLDRFSNAHVLHQSGQNTFTYCTMNPLGQILNLQRFDYSGDSRPRLGLGDDGRVFVRGGIRVVTDKDLPPAEASPSIETNVEQP